MSETKEQFVLSDQAKQGIDHWLKKYPPEQKQSAVVAALFYAQNENDGWLSEAAMNAVAAYLQLPPIVVYEAATFYDMFNLKPIGKHKISLCTNVACMLRGSDKLVHCIKERLGIGLNQTSADGMFTLREVECMAACVGAPMCQIDDKEYHENLTEEKMLAIIDDIEAREGAND